MKKVLPSLFLLLVFGLAIGQKANVALAYNAKNSGELDKAQKLIDSAVVHVKTLKKSKTWKYRGDIYYVIATSQKEEYKSLHQNPFKISFNSYKKAMEISPNSIYSDEIKSNLRMIQNLALAEGVSLFNIKEFDKAFNLFSTSFDIANYQGKVDSLAIFNCALSSERGEQYDRALEWYQKSKTIDYQAANCCSFIIHILELQGKSDKAFEQIQNCRKEFPNNQNLIISELNYYIKNGKSNEAINNLNEAIKNNPNNEILHYSLGTIKQSQGNINDAEIHFKKAIELNPNYFDAHYNLGALYYNKGVEFAKQANNEDNFEKAKTIQDKAMSLYKKSLPALEKANQINPNDYNTLLSLKALYATLGQVDKYNEIKAKLNQ